jgi:chloramphenicol 3-O-phosphotransferase
MCVPLSRGADIDDDTGQMPAVVHVICPACDTPTEGARVEPGEHALACDVCGARTPFEPLPPVLFLTGASGAGKTTLARALTGVVTEAILIDADLLWSVSPAHDDPASGYRQFRGLTLHLAERIARNGHPVVIEGTCIPEQYESLGERWYFARTAYLAVTCAEDELRRRLARRPHWRQEPARLEPLMILNERFRTEPASFSPPVQVLDTTGRTVAECAAETHAWIRKNLENTL